MTLSPNSLQPNTHGSELFELCKSVYERLDWQIDNATWVVGDENGDLFILTTEIEKQGNFDYYAPLYTSDYILDKLPHCIENDYNPVGDNWLSLTNMDDLWCAEYKGALISDGLPFPAFYDDSALIALLKLTLALADAGELGDNPS